ncbi:MAG: T9SS type A sorting domain-containing protein [Bacteroidales bacterium]|nr:T9SS type A sorting domain-containing protein [Bacteroidales bacterium]
MRKQLIPLIITLLSLIGNNCFAQTFGGGSGNSASDPYLISTKAHLIELANRVNGNGFTVNNFSGKYFKMMNDIDMSVSGTFNPIGNASNRTFRGNFNGDGHIIYNLTLSITNYVGLFGNILNATIENIGIDSTCSFTCISGESSTYYGGTLVAYARSSNINSCYSLAKITSGTNHYWVIGGLIGGAYGVSINNCYARAEILTTTYVYNTRFGGLIGETYNNINLLNSYSAPRNLNLPLYSTGYNGSLIGNVNGTNSIVNSYYLIVPETNQNFGNANGIGAMRTEQFAVELNACQTNTWRWANRDFTLNNGLPMLYWQGIGDTIGCTVTVGTPTNPFRIRYAIDLIRLSNDVSDGANYANSYFIVENDISFHISGQTDSSIYFNPIGNVTYSFQGYLNGNGHIISNLTLSATNYVGLFGNIQNATIENIGIDNNCTFTCPLPTINQDDRNYGGPLVAYSYNSNISNSFSIATININGDFWNVGGLVGRLNGGTVNNCYSRATIRRNIPNGSNEWANNYGGLIGRATNSYILSNSYSAPYAFPAYDRYNGNRRSLIGNINGDNYRIVNSYYLPISNTSNGEAGTPKTLTEMRQEAFAVLLNPNSQCSMQVWEWTNGNYSINYGLPVLYWQGIGTPLPSAFLDGAGTFTDPFLIRTVADMKKLSNCVNGGTPFTGMYFLLKNNIIFHGSSDGFNPIGKVVVSGGWNPTTTYYPFSGIFNGGGHRISNLTISSGNYVGLFGYISGATIDSLGIESCTFYSQRFGGGLCAYIESSTIKNCYSLASITSQNNNNTDYYPQIGGLIGCSNNSTIQNCYARASIFHGTTITYSYNPSYGGLIGQIANVNGSNIINCYSAPISLPSTGRRDVGSLLGYCNSGYLSNLIFNNSYYLYSTDVTSATYDYGIPKDSAELQSGCFAATLNNAQNPIVWFKAKSQVNDGYPVLSWQKLSNNLPAGFEGNCLGVTYDGGTQTTQYEIRYVKDLIYISNMVRNDTNYYNKYFQFQNNISFTDSSIYYNPIGDSNSNCFSGNIDGNGKIISNLTISKNDSVGLFGCISGATIQSLGIANRCSFTSRVYGGSLAGYASNSTIDKCFSMASLTGNATNSKIGGLIGYINGTSINNCYTINSITNSSSQSFSGGLVCLMDNNSTISNSYSSPSSFPTNGTRGILVGSITNCSNPSSNSYYDSTLNVSGMTILGISQTISQMITLDFAMDLNDCQTNVWRWANGDVLINNGLPMLYWEGIGTVLPSCGSSEYPFRIRCVADLITLTNNVANGATYSGLNLIVENDINFHRSGQIDSSQYFYPIGNRSTAFQGNFNGNGKVISNLTIDSYLMDVGLFGKVFNNATIKNLGIEGANITARSGNSEATKSHGGGIVGHIEGDGRNTCTISGCYVSSSTITGYGDFCTIGGLTGFAGLTTIENCYAIANIIKASGRAPEIYYGGLIGYIRNSTISNSYSSPISFNSNSGNRGLLVGIIAGDVTAPNSYFNRKFYVSGMNNTLGSPKDSTEMRSGCFAATLNNAQNPIVWFKAKSQVNLGYPVLSWQKLSDNITPAGFEGNCLGYNTPFVGSNSSPYKVKYVKDLIYISNMVANDTTYNENGVKKFFQMQNDINFNNGVIDSSSLYNPIGIFFNNKPFSGNFSGYSDLNSDRYAIANYSFSNVTKDNIGLFGYTKDATIKKLGISNVNISARNNIGGLVAITNNTTIDSCFVYGYINGVKNVGGLVGLDTVASTINRSFTNTTIDAQNSVGGIAGNYKGTISNSYSNSEIYSSTSANNYVGGIIGLASATPTLTKVYSVCKIIRKGTNTNFGKIIGNNIGNNTYCYSRDSVFVNCSNGIGYNGTQQTNTQLRSSPFVNLTLGSTYWREDYSPDSINDGYPIFKYQLEAKKAVANGPWQAPSNWGGNLPKASQVVIIPYGKQIKIVNGSAPISAYVKIENGGELNNTTNINLFGEYNRELYAGKWNLIGLSTYTRILSCLYNYTDSISFKTFVKRFNYTTNNWSTTTTQDINTQFNFGEGILVMPNYSLDARLIIKSRIVSKGVLFNDNTLSYTFNNTSPAINKFVSLSNNYPASLDTTLLINNNSSLIQGRLIYVYDADSGKWNNNWQSTNRVTSIKPSEGFFIGSASGTFNFNKSQIRNTSGAKNLIKSDLIYVNAFANDNVRESFLEFNEEADNAFDFEDGFMLFGSNYSSVEPYFTIPTPEINDSTLYLIKDAFSSLPYTTELDLRSQKNNEVTLNFSNIPSNIHVYLLDSLLNKAQYLNEESNYELQVSAGDNAKRLYVLFSYYKEDINEFFKPEPGEIIKIWNYDNTLNIEGKDLIRYELFDILGNKLLEEEIQDNKFNTQLNLVSGIYIVRAYSNTSSNVKKISISSK